MESVVGFTSTGPFQRQGRPSHHLGIGVALGRDLERLSRPIAANLAQGEGGVEEKAIYHAFCFISYEVGPFTEFVERGVAPSEKKGTGAGESARTLFAALEELREDVSDDEEDMEFIALDKAVGFISKTLGDFQHYLGEAGEGS